MMVEETDGSRRGADGRDEGRAERGVVEVDAVVAEVDEDGGGG